MPIWDIVNGGDLSMITSLDFSEAEKRFGGPTYAVHRVDFHTELLRLHDRKGSDEKHDGSIVPPSSLHLSSTVVDCNTKDGIVTLADGTTHRADLIVGADGIHSVIRAAVLEDEEMSKPVPTGLSAFRFLIATDELKADKNLAQLLKWKSLGATTLVDSQEKPNGERIQERHIIWYDCQEYVKILVLRSSKSLIDWQRRSTELRRISPHSSRRVAR
jgi:salicylate hydroxylase